MNGKRVSKMGIEILVAAMNRKNHDILKEMNISSDAIIVNQCAEDRIERFKYNDHNILVMSFNERGVGLSRNTALMRATQDICVFADEDMVYVDHYSEIIEREFEKNPKADVILFRIDSLNSERPLILIKKNKRVRRKEAMRYGCARVAIRRSSQQKSNIWFSLLFGGGAKYGSGEDTIFLQDCLKKGLKIYKSTQKIADIKQEDSTWFDGYTSKLFFDKGVLLATVIPFGAKFYALGMAYNYSRNEAVKNDIWEIWKMMRNGIKSKKMTNG